MSVTFDTSQIAALPSDIEHAAQAAFAPTAQAGVPLIQAQIPTRSGALRAGVKVQQTDATTAEYEISALSPEGFDYAEAIAKGRKAFQAKKGHALRIPVENLSGRVPLNAREGFIYVKSVKAAPANPYHERGADDLAEQLPEHYAQELAARL